MSAEEDGTTTRRRTAWLAFLPVALFVVLAGVFLLQLLSGRDQSVVPSALIGEPAPGTSLAPIAATGLPGLESSAFAGRVTLVNVWASWCAPCRQEHPLLLELSKDTRLTIAGLNYKDAAENAAGFLSELGNPYSAIGQDMTGRAAIDWGVYGVPETFLVGRDGTILYKHVGPLTEPALKAVLMPEIEKALRN